MKISGQKLARCLLLAFLLINGTGCMTANAIHKARSQTHRDNAGKSVTEKGHPAAYSLLLITIPADIATSPFQAIAGSTVCGGIIFYQ